MPPGDASAAATGATDYVVNTHLREYVGGLGSEMLRLEEDVQCIDDAAAIDASSACA